MDPAFIAGIGVVGTLAGVSVNELFASKRANKTIGAQERQLTQQLTHDRALRDLEELRSILDDAATAATRITDGFITWISFLEALDMNALAEVEEARRLQTTVYEEIFGLSRYQLRVDLRLMFDSDVSEAFGRVRDCWAEAFTAVGPLRKLSPEDNKKISELMERAAEEYGRFIVVAHALVQSRPDDAPPV